MDEDEDEDFDVLKADELYRLAVEAYKEAYKSSPIEVGNPIAENIFLRGGERARREYLDQLEKLQSQPFQRPGRESLRRKEQLYKKNHESVRAIPIRVNSDVRKIKPQCDTKLESLPQIVGIGGVVPQRLESFYMHVAQWAILTIFAASVLLGGVSLVRLREQKRRARSLSHMTFSMLRMSEFDNERALHMTGESDPLCGASCCSSKTRGKSVTFQTPIAEEL
eukprot:CAMPEP_0184497414 /NCGR_PEP_ID=MMETSP0113_2-20130426/36481_1 /TAXON_ID=91329 /ORGANISM="Norrisiella sphaerica, Strain BC52" /LENGTH=222 /DNA_ID=CAMNT_0026884509 /DNA_START=420 /DNA_END=1088 /DNA_ORIENTATION=-